MPEAEPDPVPTAHPLSHAEQVYAIKTWRYLRMGMVALVAGLAVAIVYERAQATCFQGSVSGYYYTPVRGYFVGALVAIGACLICLKGSSEAEDVLLNLAGICAPVVALVPTHDTGHCASVPFGVWGRDAGVADNVTALLAVGLLAIVVLAALARRERPTRPQGVGYAAAAAVWLVVLLAFELDRGCFVRYAHYPAAGLMFACIIAVVWLNALGYRRDREAESVLNRYAAIAIAMLASLLVIPIGLAVHWHHWLIVLEGALIGWFAAFWVIQTAELWHEGLR